MALERLGLVIRSAPWVGRAGRDALDLALAAATLDIALDLFFIGDGALQLLADREPGPAGLPPGYRAWASLPDLGEVRYHVDADQWAALESSGARCLIEAHRVPAADMPALQAACDCLLVA